MTTTHTIDPTDGLDTSEREAAEARAFEVGSKLVEEQAAAQEERYESARQTEEANLRYAGKYKSAEDLEKAYLELQRKLGEQGASPQEEPTDEPEEAPEQEDQDQGEEEEADEVVEILQKANEEFYSESGLTKDTIEELAKLDSRTLVEKWAEYIQGQQQQAKEQPGLQQTDVDRVMKAVGGTDNYNQMLAWAGENLSPDEVSAYDEVMNSGNADAIYWAALGLKSRYADAVGIEGTVYTGARAPKAEPGFRSQAELARAIADPRYREDPAYRLDVEAKLARSGDLL